MPPARVVLLCGPSGSGKSTLVRRLGLPVLALDDFYRDGDGGDDDDDDDNLHDTDDTPGHAPLPRRFGIVDWDDVGSWDAAGALDCLRELCTRGEAQVPLYDIPTSRRTGTAHLDLAGSALVLAEGIFAAHLVAECTDTDLLADALCLRLNPWTTFCRRLLRDLVEHRKPLVVLLRRGNALRRAEPQLVARWCALGARPLSPAQARRAVRGLNGGTPVKEPR